MTWPRKMHKLLEDKIKNDTLGNMARNILKKLDAR